MILCFAHTFYTIPPGNLLFNLQPATTITITNNHESSMASSPFKVSWDDDAHKALVGALLEVLDGNGVSYRTPANQTALVTSMADRGKPFSWEGIR